MPTALIKERHISTLDDAGCTEFVIDFYGLLDDYILDNEMYFGYGHEIETLKAKCHMGFEDQWDAAQAWLAAQKLIFGLTPEVEDIFHMGDEVWLRYRLWNRRYFVTVQTAKCVALRDDQQVWSLPA